MSGRVAIVVATMLALTSTTACVGPATVDPGDAMAKPQKNPSVHHLAVMKSIAADGLVVTLHPGPRPATVIMRVVNPTSTTKTFCDYHTPFEGLRNHIFIVTGSDGATLEYRGAMAKRAPPDDDDFLDVPGGGVLESRPLDLTGGYAMTMGTWQVVFAGNTISGLPSSSSLTLTVP